MQWRTNLVPFRCHWLPWMARLNHLDLSFEMQRVQITKFEKTMTSTNNFFSQILSFISSSANGQLEDDSVFALQNAARRDLGLRLVMVICHQLQIIDLYQRSCGMENDRSTIEVPRANHLDSCQPAIPSASTRRPIRRSYGCEAVDPHSPLVADERTPESWTGPTATSINNGRLAERSSVFKLPIFAVSSLAP